MSNYNERLEQQLFRALTKGGLEKEKEIESKGRYIHRPMKSIVHEEAQAITSLTKEMVAEAKPKRAVIHYDELGIDRARKSAANSALDRFEQNLLKALEEK